jgi:hypothetical protein
MNDLIIEQKSLTAYIHQVEGYMSLGIIQVSALVCAFRPDIAGKLVSVTARIGIIVMGRRGLIWYLQLVSARVPCGPQVGPEQSPLVVPPCKTQSSDDELCTVCHCKPTRCCWPLTALMTSHRAVTHIHRCSSHTMLLAPHSTVDLAWHC